MVKWLVMVVALATFGCVAEQETDVSGYALNAAGAFCGGIAGIPCPAGYECVDDPGDGCDPAAGGADCGGVCQRNHCTSAGRTYVWHDPDSCAVGRFTCADGQQYFFDSQCGCGCETIDGCAATGLCVAGYHWDEVHCRCVRDQNGGARCGDRHCGRGEYCCNASCGICAPIDGGCIQIACAPAPRP